MNFLNGFSFKDKVETPRIPKARNRTFTHKVLPPPCPASFISPHFSRDLPQTQSPSAPSFSKYLWSIHSAPGLVPTMNDKQRSPRVWSALSKDTNRVYSLFVDSIFTNSPTGDNLSVTPKSILPVLSWSFDNTQGGKTLELPQAPFLTFVCL